MIRISRLFCNEHAPKEIYLRNEARKSAGMYDLRFETVTLAWVRQQHLKQMRATAKLQSCYEIGMC